jgi:YspA, cpYpsA-related SLOG family
LKTIIAGSRLLTDERLVFEAVEASGFTITEVVSGNAPGVDWSGEAWGKANGVSVRIFRAEWNRFGHGAGPRRNRQMVEYAEALIAIPHPTQDSRGTLNVIRQAEAKGLRVFVFRG